MTNVETRMTNQGRMTNDEGPHVRAIAVSVLLLGAVCVVLQVAPAAVPKRVAVMVVAGTLAIFGVGMIVDLFSYAKPDDWLASFGGWIGFAVVLAGVFALPRVRPPAGA